MDMSCKTCFVVSIIAGVCAAVFMFGFTFLRYQKFVGALSLGAIIGFGAFVICYLALVLAARATKKRQDELNAEPEDDFDEEERHIK